MLIAPGRVISLPPHRSGGRPDTTHLLVTTIPVQASEILVPSSILADAYLEGKTIKWGKISYSYIVWGLQFSVCLFSLPYVRKGRIKILNRIFFCILPSLWMVSHTFMIPIREVLFCTHCHIFYRMAPLSIQYIFVRE